MCVCVCLSFLVSLSACLYLPLSDTPGRVLLQARQMAVSEAGVFATPPLSFTIVRIPYNGIPIEIQNFQRKLPIIFKRAVLYKCTARRRWRVSDDQICTRQVPQKSQETCFLVLQMNCYFV